MRVPDVVAGHLASAVPVQKSGKNGRVLRVVTRKGALTTENVKRISVTFVEENEEMAPDISLEQEVILFYRLPGRSAGAGLR